MLSPMDRAYEPGLETSTGAAAAAVDPRAGGLSRLVSLDEALLLSFQKLRTPLLTGAARTLTRIGDASSWTVAGLALLATFDGWGLHLGLRLGAATLLATVLSQVLKRVLRRPRPDARIAGFQALARNPDRFSFPSGHTAAAVAVAVAFAGEPHGVGAAAAALASGIALSRVYLGAHYPLDVAAGALLGAMAGIASRLLVV